MYLYQLLRVIDFEKLGIYDFVFTSNVFSGVSHRNYKDLNTNCPLLDGKIDSFWIDFENKVIRVILDLM